MDGHHRFVVAEGCGGNLGAHDWDRGQVKCACGSHRVLCRSQDQKLDVYTQQHRRSVKEPLTKKVENRMKATESPQWIKNSCTQSNNTYFKRTYSNKKTPTQTVACERGVMQVQYGGRGTKTAVKTLLYRENALQFGSGSPMAKDGFSTLLRPLWFDLNYQNLLCLFLPWSRVEEGLGKGRQYWVRKQCDS